MEPLPVEREATPLAEVHRLMPARRREGMLGAALHAWDGLVFTLARQRNMKVHVVSAELVGCVGCGIPLGLPEKVSLVFCVMLVFFAEVVNTALEALVDLHTEDFRDLAKVTKDTAAAGVLVLAIGTFVIFSAILVNDWGTVMSHPTEVVRQFAYGIPLVALGGMLPWKRPGPRWPDVPILLAALAIWSRTVTWSTSPVFSGMLVSLLALQAASAYELRWNPHPAYRS